MFNISHRSNFIIKAFTFTTLFVISFAHIATAAEVFTVDMTLGTTNSQVRALQQFLNLDTRTRVAMSGIGSPGQETDYFGQKTSDAVKRFQTLYSVDILEPLGLTQATGYVGRSTRQVLNYVAGVIGFTANSSVAAMQSKADYQYSYQVPAQTQVAGQVSATNPADTRTIYVTNNVTNVYSSTTPATTTASSAYTDPYAGTYNSYASTTKPKAPTTPKEEPEPEEEPEEEAGGEAGGGAEGGGAGGEEAGEEEKANTVGDLLKELGTQLLAQNLLGSLFGQVSDSSAMNFRGTVGPGLYCQCGQNEGSTLFGIIPPTDSGGASVSSGGDQGTNALTSAAEKQTGNKSSSTATPAGSASPSTGGTPSAGTNGGTTGLTATAGPSGAAATGGTSAAAGTAGGTVGSVDPNGRKVLNPEYKVGQEGRYMEKGIGNPLTSAKEIFGIGSAGSGSSGGNALSKLGNYIKTAAGSLFGGAGGTIGMPKALFYKPGIGGPTGFGGIPKPVTGQFILGKYSPVGGTCDIYISYECTPVMTGQGLMVQYNVGFGGSSSAGGSAAPSGGSGQPGSSGQTAPTTQATKGTGGTTPTGTSKPSTTNYSPSGSGSKAQDLTTQFKTTGPTP